MSPIPMKDKKKFKLNTVLFGGIIEYKSSLTRGHYGRSKDTMFLTVRACDVEDNSITLLFDSSNAVYVSKYYRDGDFIAVTGCLEKDAYNKYVFVRVNQVAFPVELHIKKAEKEMKSIEYEKGIEEMIEESEENNE